jgi:hypothetical protein
MEELKLFNRVYEDNKEIWINIKDYEGLYQISNFGRVKSLERIKKPGKGFYFRKERVLRETKDKDGYLYVVLLKESYRYTVKIHRLVAKAFIPNPEDKKQVNHKNGIKTDNNVDNLEWVTQSENITHSFRVLGQKPNMAGLGKFGIDSKRSMKVCQYSIDGEFIKQWDSGADASRSLNIPQSNISSCSLNRPGYNHAGGFKWIRQ